MKRSIITPLLLALLMTGATGLASAQSSDGGTGGQPAITKPLNMDRSEFLRTHTWDANSEMWVVSAGYDAPTGVLSRAQVKAEREKYMTMNRWDEPTSTWMPINGEPRKMSSMSREQVRAETIAFNRTHAWNETTGKWGKRTNGGGAQ